MTVSLHLGVVDMPYAHDPKGTSTGDVAEILEARYHVMEVFFELHRNEIAADMEKSVAGAIDTLMAGAPPQNASPFAGAESGIERRFKDFLLTREIETLGIPGVPTQAALDGVSHRFKNPRYVRKGKKLVKRPRRPSFIDTGLYETAMKAWFE